MVAPEVSGPRRGNGGRGRHEGGRRGAVRQQEPSGPQPAPSADVDAMLLAEAGRHPHPAPESEPAPKRPHVVGSPDDATPGHRAFVVGTPAQPATRAKDQGHQRHRGAAAGTNRVVGAAAAIASGAAAAKDQSGGARRGSPPAQSTASTRAAAPPAAEVAALTADVFARLANREGTPSEAPQDAAGDTPTPPAQDDADTTTAAAEELEAAAEAAVAAGGQATAPAVASAAARRAGPNGRGALPPITPCSSLADPASVQGQLADALIRAAARGTPAASPSPFDGGSPEPQGSTSGGDGGAVASTPPRPPPPSAAGSCQTGGSSAGVRSACAQLGPELRQREGSGLREPPSTPATKSGTFAAATSSEGLPFARSLPETPPTTPMWPSSAVNNIQQWGSGRLGREGSSASGGATGGAGSGAETPAATATSGPAAVSRSGGGGGGVSSTAPVGVDSEQLRTAMQGLAVGNGKEWDEEQGDGCGGMETGRVFSAAPSAAAAVAEGLARPTAAAANGLPVVNGLPGGVAALPQPAPVPRGTVTPLVSRRLPAEIPAIPEDAAVTPPPPLPQASASTAVQPSGATLPIAEEANGSSHGTADSTTGSAAAEGGVPLPALPFVRVSSTHSAASAALEEALLYSVPLDEMALRSASRGGTPRAGSVSYASSTASSQDRPDLAELAAFGTGGHGGVCVAGRGHHRLASSSGRSRSRSPSPSPFAGDMVQRGVRAQLGGRSWSSGGVGAATPAADSGAAMAASAAAAAKDAPIAAAAVETSAPPVAPRDGLPPPPLPGLLGAPSDVADAPPRPLLPAASSPLAPNRCVTELPAAEQARLWDSDAPVAVPQHSAVAGPHVRGATPSGRPPSSLLRRGRGDSPWWAAWGCGCFAPQDKYEDDSRAGD